MAASLRARELGLRFATLEQDTLGGTVAHYPRGKIVMTAPVDLPGFGRVKMRETSKEALLELWRKVIDQTELQIETGQRVTSVSRSAEGLDVETTTKSYRTRAVILSIGRRGTPRQLGVPGEELEKVVYRLVDPEQYAGRRVLVVGGGDSALEAAIAISEQPGSHVTLSYRGDAFSRAKAANRDRLDAAAAGGSLDVLLQATPEAILPDSVRIDTGVGTKELANDAVIVCIGGVLPTGFLRDAGVEIEVRHGE
jgi:thioredoxin reductase